MLLSAGIFFLGPASGSSFNESFLQQAQAQKNLLKQQIPVLKSLKSTLASAMDNVERTIAATAEPVISQVQQRSTASILDRLEKLEKNVRVEARVIMAIEKELDMKREGLKKVVSHRVGKGGNKIQVIKWVKNTGKTPKVKLVNTTASQGVLDSREVSVLESEANTTESNNLVTMVPKEVLNKDDTDVIKLAAKEFLASEQKTKSMAEKSAESASSGTKNDKSASAVSMKSEQEAEKKETTPAISELDLDHMSPDQMRSFMASQISQADVQDMQTIDDPERNFLPFR